MGRAAVGQRVDHDADGSLEVKCGMRKCVWQSVLLAGGAGSAAQWTVYAVAWKQEPL